MCWESVGNNIIQVCVCGGMEGAVLEMALNIRLKILAFHHYVIPSATNNIGIKYSFRNIECGT